MKNLKLPAVVLASVALTAVLAGCTATGAATDAKSSDKPAGSQTTQDAPKVNECIDGAATILAGEDHAPISLPDGCETVYVVASNLTVDLGPTANLIFEGTGNAVTYTGEAPTISGVTEGDGNSVIAK